MKRRPIQLLVAIGLCLFAIGVAISLSLIRAEGVEGIWNRKKDLINRVRPDAAPVVQSAEDKVRKELGSTGTP